MQDLLRCSVACKSRSVQIKLISLLKWAINVRHGSNFGTKLWTSAPNDNVDTKFDWSDNFGTMKTSVLKLMNCVEVNIWCRSSSAEVRLPIFEIIVGKSRIPDPTYNDFEIEFLDRLKNDWI